MTTRRPQFIFDDDEGDDSERDESRAVPAIVVQDAQTPPLKSAPDLDEEERHVGWAPGTEGKVEDEQGQETEGTYPPSPKKEEKSGFDSTKFDEEGVDETPKTLKDRLPPLPSALAWIPPHLNWKGLRPVLRASLAAWCGLILMLCTKSEAVLGQASFLVLIVATICPAALPIASMLEQTVFQFLLVSLSWAWACIALVISHAVRHKYKLTQSEFTAQAAARYASAGTAAEISTAIQEGIFHGDYLEANSSAVCAVFLGVGVGFLLWLRGYLGPGPATFGVIFAIILQVIMLTIAPLFPYAYYGIGLIFYIPFSCQLAINLACTFFVFPETLAHQFSDRLIATLTPLQKVIRENKGMLEANPTTDEWLKYKSLRTGANAGLAGVALLGLSESNLTREVTYARVNGKDLSKMLQNMRVLAARTTGFAHFYEIVEKHLHRDESDAKGGTAADDLVLHLGRSRQNSGANSPSSSRPASPTRERRGSSGSHRADAEALDKALERVKQENYSHHSSPSHTPHAPSPLSPSPRPKSVRNHHSDSHLRRNGVSSSSLTDLPEHATQEGDRRPSHDHPSHPPRSGRHRSRDRSRHHKHSSSHISIPSLLHDVLHPNLDIRPIGILESTAYADLEDMLHNPRDEEHLSRLIKLLSSSSAELLTTLDTSVSHLIETIHRFKSLENTFASVMKYDEKAVEELIVKSKAQLDKLKQAYKNYRDVKRLEVIKPFAQLFDPYGTLRADEEEDAMATPSHRGLFWSMSYQNSLLGWSEALIELFETIHQVENKRRRPRLWFPDLRKAYFAHTGAENDYGDEDPDALRDLNTQAFSAPRNPDYKPPSSLLQVIGIKVGNLADVVTRRDVLFGMKAGLIVALCSLPAYFPSTSYFFYRERGVWVIIMVCLTTNQYVGDVLFGFIVRVFGTFFGAAVGLMIWSIAAQTGKGNPFAVAATCAVFYPFIFFYRVHQTPIMTAILPAVTAQLVIGYSWQDAHAPSLSSVGYGWDVAWRRFVCVMIGISIAFVWAFFPPATRQKVTIRRTYSKVIGRLGDLVAQVLSFANTKDGPVKPPRVIVNNLTALRARVNRTVQARAMARYELSLQGEWPSEIYARLQLVQMEILDMLGQFTAVISKLDAKWTKALLHRTQLANPRFLQDLLTTFQLISGALENGTPLPFIYNPLLERFLNSPEKARVGHGYGYDVVLDGDEDAIEGLPLHVDLATICSLDYLRFSAGASQAYAIVNRVDRLMFVAKSLVGENYLIYGLDTTNYAGGRYHRLANDRELEEDHFGTASTRTSFDRREEVV